MMNPSSIKIISDIGKLGSGDRLTIPAEVRRAASWLGGAHPQELVAELVVPGYLLLHPLETGQSRLADARKQIEEHHPNSLDHLSAVADRYRSVTFYPSDNRVHLGSAVRRYLEGSGSQGNREFLIESRGVEVAVISLEIRNNRLRQLADDLALTMPDLPMGL